MNMNYFKLSHIFPFSLLLHCGSGDTREDQSGKSDSLDRHQGRGGLYINDRGKEPGNE